MQKIVYLLIALVLGSLILAPVVASEGDGISSYQDTIPNSTQNPVSNNDTINGVVIQSINPNGNPLSLNRYTPASLRLVYASASSYFLNVSYATSTEHYETQSSNDMSVQISGDGSYGFRFNVLYDAPINQTVTLVVTGGDGMQDSYPINCPTCSGFSLDVSISTIVLPHYPTASEISQANNDFTRDMVSNVTQQYETQYKADADQNRNLSIGAIAGVVIALVLIFFVIRWARRNDRRQSEFEMMFPKFEPRSE